MHQVFVWICMLFVWIRLFLELNTLKLHLLWWNFRCALEHLDHMYVIKVSVPQQVHTEHWSLQGGGQALQPHACSVPQGLSLSAINSACTCQPQLGFWMHPALFLDHKQQSLVGVWRSQSWGVELITKTDHQGMLLLGKPYAIVMTIYVFRVIP